MEVVLIAVLVLVLTIATGAAVRYIVNDGGGPQRQPPRLPDSYWHTYAHHR